MFSVSTIASSLFKCRFLGIVQIIESGRIMSPTFICSTFGPAGLSVENPHILSAYISFQSSVILYLEHDHPSHIFKPPPPIGAGGGYMFSGRASVRPSVIHIVVSCFRDISSICWRIFAKLLSLVHLATEMNWLDFGVKWSKVKVTAWPNTSQIFMFPRYLQYLLTDFCQTFVTGASWDTDDLIAFWVKRLKVQGHTIAAEAHSTRRYHRVQPFLVMFIVCVALRSLPQLTCAYQSWLVEKLTVLEGWCLSRSDEPMYGQIYLIAGQYMKLRPFVG